MARVGTTTASLIAVRKRAAVVGVGAALAAAALSGCSSSDETPDPAPAEAQVMTATMATQELIAGPVAESAGLALSNPVCPDMSAAVPGETFTCSATTEDQATVRLTATLQPSGQVEVATVNVITAQALGSFETAAIDALNAEVQVPLGYDDIDCGGSSVVIADDATIVCALKDPQTEAIFDVTLTISDVENRVFRVIVADAPRR